MGMETTDLVADLNRLYEDGSGDANLGKCTALLSHSLVERAVADGATAVEAARVLLEMVAERATAPTQKAVLAAAAITGIAPRDWRGRGRRDSPNNLDRAEAAAKVANVMPDTARKRREDTYNPAYAEAIVAFERDTKRNSDLLTEFLRRCGALPAAGSSRPALGEVHDAPLASSSGRGLIQRLHPWFRWRLAQLLGKLKDFFALLLLSLLLCFPIIVLILVPTTTWSPITVADWLLQPINAICVFCPFFVSASTTSHWRWLPATMLTVAVAAPVAVGGAHFWRYNVETGYGERTELAARHGDVIYLDEFDHEGSCPPEPHRYPDKSRALPFTACQLAGGSLHTTMSSHLSTAVLGVYSTGDTFFTTSIASPPRRIGYYIKTRFRAAGGSPLSACAISVEAAVSGVDDPDFSKHPDRSLLFHLQQTPGHGGADYFGEVATTSLHNETVGQIPRIPAGPQWNFITPTVLARGDDDWLPYVGQASLLGWEYDTWTSFGVILEGDQFKFLVNDRLVAQGAYPGLNRVFRASLATLAGGASGSSTAACEFDYLRVRRLPS